WESISCQRVAANPAVSAPGARGRRPSGDNLVDENGDRKFFERACRWYRTGFHSNSVLPDVANILVLRVIFRHSYSSNAPPLNVFGVLIGSGRPADDRDQSPVAVGALERDNMRGLHTRDYQRTVASVGE